MRNQLLESEQRLVFNAWVAKQVRSTMTLSAFMTPEEIAQRIADDMIHSYNNGRVDAAAVNDPMHELNAAMARVDARLEGLKNATYP